MHTHTWHSSIFLWILFSLEFPCGHPNESSRNKASVESVLSVLRPRPPPTPSLARLLRTTLILRARLTSNCSMVLFLSWSIIKTVPCQIQYMITANFVYFCASDISGEFYGQNIPLQKMNKPFSEAKPKKDALKVPEELKLWRKANNIYRQLIRVKWIDAHQ